MNINIIIFQLAIASMIVDVLVEFIKMLFDKYFKTKDIKYKNIVLRSVSIFIGMFICICYKLNFPNMCGLTTTIPCIGEFITGILISRGSNTFHDTLKKFDLINTKL